MSMDRRAGRAEPTDGRECRVAIGARRTPSVPSVGRSRARVEYVVGTSSTSIACALPVLPIHEICSIQTSRMTILKVYSGIYLNAS